MADVKDLKTTVPTRSSEGADEIETFLAPSAAELEKRRAAAGIADGIDAGARVRHDGNGGGQALHIIQPGPVGVSPSRGGGSARTLRFLDMMVYGSSGPVFALPSTKLPDIDREARRVVAGPSSHAYFVRLFGKDTPLVEELVRGVQAATIRNSNRTLSPLGALLILNATPLAKNPHIRAGIERAKAENRSELSKSGLTPAEIAGLERAATRQATAGAKGWEKDARRIQNEITQEAAAGSTGIGASGPAMAKTERQRGDAFAIPGGDTSAEADHHRRLVEEAASLASADRKAAANRQAEGRARAGSNPDLARGAVRLSDLG